MNIEVHSRSSFRAQYAELQNSDGTVRKNVFADVSLPGLAPVLKNPLMQFAFMKYLTREVAALNLRKGQHFSPMSFSIIRLQKLGYYCEPVPSGFVPAIKFYLGFLEALK